MPVQNQSQPAPAAPKPAKIKATYRLTINKEYLYSLTAQFIEFYFTKNKTDTVVKNFINSFFICLTTFLILKLVKVPPKAYVSEHIFKRQKWGLSILGVLVILPSLYMTYNSVSDNLRQSQVKSYIEKNFNTYDMQVVSYRIESDKKELELTLIGRNITENERKEFAEKLRSYPRLAELNLHIIQNDLSGTVRAEDLQNMVDKHWETVGGATLNQTQEELKKYKELALLYAPAYKRAEEDKKILANIRAKAPLIFPQFDGIEAASVASKDEKGNAVYRQMLALVYVKTPMLPEDSVRFQNWLNAETGMEVTVMYAVKPVENKDVQ